MPESKRDERRAIVAPLVAAGATAQEIAAALGVSFARAKQITRALGLPTRRQQQVRARRARTKRAQAPRACARCAGPVSAGSRSGLCRACARHESRPGSGFAGGAAPGANARKAVAVRWA